jgi:iron complex outermembrane receptor protein
MKARIRARTTPIAFAAALIAAGLISAGSAASSAARAETAARGFAATQKPSQRGAAQNGSGYYVPNVTDAAGNSVPVMQVPGSVVVVPRQVMDDQQDITVCGALRNVSGVSCR